MVLVFLVVVLIPITIGIWLLNLAVYVLYNGNGEYVMFASASSAVRAVYAVRQHRSMFSYLLVLDVDGMGSTEVKTKMQPASRTLLSAVIG